MEIRLPDSLPKYPTFVEGIRRAPSRGMNLNKNQIKIALKNALRYIPKKLHSEIAPEFLEELLTRGRIYGYRYRPEGDIRPKSIEEYEGKCLAGKALQVMIDNNLSFDIALYPYELVTYGETGQVMQNWMQYRLIKKYLEILTEQQTLVVQSGHPLGLFPSKKDAPRVISTNGLMVGMFDNPKDFAVAAAMGVANYGQMTAGGWMYIGPQGIVHGTYITLLNAGRLYLKIPDNSNLKGVLYLSSGLGGMSGAQAKAVEIAGGVGIIAEVDYSRIETRHKQGWVSVVCKTKEETFDTALKAKKEGKALSIAYYGNIVDLWEYAVKNNIKIELASDQTSCHAVYEGGYIPAGYSFEKARKLLETQPEKFKEAVDISLKKQFNLIKEMTDRGTYFWDYGNSFMKAVFDAGEKDISKNKIDTSEGFIFPSYVEHIMGPLCFDFGYGPFRWVCLSGKDEDLKKTDAAAMSCIDPNRRSQDMDNYNWIRDAEKNKLVVGTKARILYADEEGRVKIALKFNEMVRNREIGPVMLGRDHHDVSGTDSPFRETANIYDGSNVMAEMAVHCFAGNCARGMTLAVLSNGGGVGIGKSFNGGFGLLLDGKEDTDKIIKSAVSWDVIGGIARRAWARNDNAIKTSALYNNREPESHITMPEVADSDFVNELVEKKIK